MPEAVGSYRIRTEIGSNAPSKINVNLNQTFDTLEILSLKLTQENAYKLYESSYGVIVGRVLANGSFGVPNAKLSIFIEVNDDETLVNQVLYPYTSATSSNNDGIRYNLLPDEEVSECHQNVGSFPNKRLVLDNNNIIEIFNKYWKYTTVTNEAGDYMFFGIPSGNQQLHVDIDISDIGILSQRPRDMVYKGYNIELFESPNKFRQDSNLNSLSQIYTQNKGIYVYPFWGDTSQTIDTIAVTRCDIEMDYKIEPTCIFMGCAVSDTASNTIGKKCNPANKNGKMSELIASEGSIEMIRKTPDNKIEEYQVKGNRVIDGNGVWCYQIPMNLDYIKTDEYGNTVPTDDPNSGIPTRARVRFRITLDESANDSSARKRCKMLVPNNPRVNPADYPIFSETLEVDYEFGSATRDEDFVDLLWNKVYTVKSYIPRLQTEKEKSITRHHTGIKEVNRYGDNNPMPYNNFYAKLNFTYRIICAIVKIIINIVRAANVLISAIAIPIETLLGILRPLAKFKVLGIKFGKILGFQAIYNLVYKMLPTCIILGSNFCDDGVNPYEYAPGCVGGTLRSKTKKNVTSGYKLRYDTTALNTCVENGLAQDNDVTCFNFHNDWINGVIYFPLWYRKITAKKSFLFGLISRKAKDQWCSAERSYSKLKLLHPCAIEREEVTEASYTNNEGDTIIPRYTLGDNCSKSCDTAFVSRSVDYGIVVSKTTITGATAYYYKPVLYSASLNNKQGDVYLLFATDIVLLGSLNDCDVNGLPQFFKNLESTTYRLPEDILQSEWTYTSELVESDEEDDESETEGEYSVIYDSSTEMTGCDWGNTNNYDQGTRPDGGVYYGISCSDADVRPKSCVNLIRACEYGVTLDETRFIQNLSSGDEDTEDEYSDNLLIPDGFISYDELANIDERSMFATLNSNKLRTKYNATSGMYEYDLRYLYPENFDGSMYSIMKDQQEDYDSGITYRNNYKLERFSRDYYRFRMGDTPLYYDNNGAFPRYENSFYFYFGLKSGETAIEQFNSNFYSSCTNDAEASTNVVLTYTSNGWCNDTKTDWDGYVALEMIGISTPYSIVIEGSGTAAECSFRISGISDEKIYFSNVENTEKEGEDFVRITTDDENNTIYLINGTYTITIVDANEVETELELTYTSTYLTYSTYVQDFLLSADVLSEQYGDSKTVASAGFTNEITIDTDDNTASRDIGGLIYIYNLYYKYKSLIGNYAFKIVVSAVDSEDTYSATIVFTEEGEVDSYVLKCDGSIYTTPIVYKVEDNCIAIGVPTPLSYYDIQVAQLCDGEETKNSVSNKVYVDGVEGLSLEINGIEYELIKNFVSGWTISGEADNEGKITLSYTSKGVRGWDKMYDYTNEYYNWDYDSTYSIEGLEEGSEDYNNVIAKRKSKAEAVAKAFTIYNSTGAYFYLSATSDSENLPILYNIIYKEEETSDEGKTIIEDEVVSSVETYVENILMPTLTNPLDEDYGSNVYADQNDRMCYAVDENDVYKPPYFVCCIDAVENRIPSSTGGTYDESDWPNGSVANYFGVHLLRKLLTEMEFLSLSYIGANYISSVAEEEGTKGIPYYYPSNSDYNGKYLVKNGLVYMLMYNGESEAETIDDEPFTTQTLGKDKLNIRTITITETDGEIIADEDASTVKRIIIGSNEDEYTYYANDVEGNLEELEISTTYASVTSAKELDLEISDGNITIEETVYGDMYITLDEDTTDEYIEAMEEGGSYSITLDINNSAYDAETMEYTVVYAFKYDTDNDIFAINKFVSDGIMQDESGNSIISQYSDYDTYCRYGNVDYDYYETEGLSYIDTNLVSTFYSYNEDYEGDSTDIQIVQTNGYGTCYSGQCTFKGLENGSQYFFIAITPNNCKAISPVYDFITPTFSFSLSGSSMDTYNVAITAKLPSGEEDKNVSIYYEVVEPETSEDSGLLTLSFDTYYLKYYPCTIVNFEVTGTLSNLVSSSSNDWEMDKDEDGVISYSITLSTSAITALNTIINNGAYETTGGTITVRDITGLLRIAEIGNSDI